MFNKEQDLKEIHDTLMSYFREHTYFFVSKDGITISVPENGDNCFWFDDLVNVIIEKQGDKEVLSKYLQKTLNGVI